jgi:DHA3 family macrolide efflux protein-like MFS transporter
MGANHLRRLAANSGFWLLLIGQSVSSLGDILYTVAVLSFTYAATRSAVGTASIMILTTVVRLVAGFVTVQVIDRLPHRTLMIGSDLVRAVAVAALAVFARGGALALPAIYAVTAVAAFAGAFFTPARSAILPALVEREHLVRANGLIASAVQLVQTGGWALGAGVVLVIGAPAAILINAASFLLSALATAFIAPPAPPPPWEGSPAAPMGPLERLKSGWTEVWSNRVVRDVTIMDGLETFANTIWTSPLMLAFTVQVLKVGQEWWGYQSSAYFVGTIIGGVVAALAAGWLSRWGGWTIALSSGSFALLTVWYVFAGNAPLAVALCVAFGPVYQLRDVMQSSMLQASLDPRAIGRAFATREMLLMGLFGPALVAMSLLADVAGPRSAFLVGAGLYGVVAVFAALSVPIRSYKLSSTAA